MTDTRIERARAALWGLAIGDALGMPTQMMSHGEVSATFGDFDGFRPAGPEHPIAANMAAGSVTDDTEQAIVLARELITGAGHVNPRRLAKALVAWEDDMRERGSLDLLGPSTKAALDAVIRGESLETAGRYGATNGAAMRIAPVGISIGATNLAALVDRVVEASFVTHNTGVAIAGASAVAAAISAGIDGASVREATDIGVAAATLGEARGYWVAAASVPRRIEWAVSLADPDDPDGSVQRIRELVGTSLATQESVPAALGILAVFPDDPWSTCLAAARQGGDSDTIAAIAGAISGACHGIHGFPTEAVRTVRTVNRDLDLDEIADALLTLRGET
ncbi:MAG: ADP-ribosylglycohydrolase family protein [Micrococcales bacterium]|nr:ADP-ribosylglycohydrolase family protein [Micrococcales bacterium]